MGVAKSARSVTDNLSEASVAGTKQALKSQNPNPKFQIITNHQMTKIRNPPHPIPQGAVNLILQSMLF